MTDNPLDLIREFKGISGLLKEIYGDLAKPGVQQVGKALEGILGLGNTILWPLHLLNARTRISLEANLERFRVEMEKVDDVDVIAVTPEIGVPIAERLGYYTDENLTPLFVNLLSKAANRNLVDQAHPSFINVISNLSPDDAYLLESLHSRENVEYAIAKWRGPVSYDVASEAVVHEELLSRLAFPDNIPAYVSNLCGLGLAALHPGRTLFKSEKYAQIEQYWSGRFPKTHPEDTSQVLGFENGIISITAFGRQFMAACRPA